MKYLRWIKDHIVAVLGGIVAILAFVLYRKWKQGEVDSLKDALTVSKAVSNIKALDAKREMLGERIEGREAEIAEINESLEDNKRAIVEARTGAKGLSSDEILAEYKRLGYL
jgi:hypothetical protein